MRAAIFLVLLAGTPAWCQPKGPTPENANPAPNKTWAYSLNVAGYLIPEDRSYASPTFEADRNRLHLEGRYNYEGFETGSLWAGYNFSAGEKVTIEVTPMLGGVFGNTNGFAPGYKLALGYRKLGLTSDGEYVLDAKDVDNRFFYTWNEFVYSPAEWFHAGLVGQRTRAYQSSLDVQRGFSIGGGRKAWDFTVYTFNLGWEEPTMVLNLGFTF